MASDASGLTATFTVTNSTASAEVYSLDCGVFAPVSSCSVNQGSVSVPANSSALFGVTYSTGSTGGTGPLYAYATPTIHPGDTFEGYYNVVVTAPTYSVTVTVVGGPDSIEVGISATYAFRVHNGSTAAATFTLACAQSGGAICGTPAPASITLGSGQDGDVTVIGTGGTTLGAASLTLSASGPASGSAVKSVTIFRSYPLKPFSPSGNRVVRSGCPITTAGPGSAVQCGDLLYAHALPGYRSMGRPRTVTLLYSSATAKPTPVVAVDYATYPGDAPPQALRIELNNITNGSVRIAQVYFSTSGFTFSAKQTHRLTIPINADSLQLGTGAYPLQISVFKKLGGVWQDQSPDTATTRLLVVNRRASAFGAGWWEAGVERIVPDATGALLVLADGSATYFPRNGTLYQSPPGEYSTLSTTANGYKRVLKGNRVTVWYGSSGLPDSITDNNPARNRAVYAWSGERLVSITDPVGKTISFLVDASARINRIKIPGSDTVRLQQSVHSGATDADLDQITDPDGLGSPFSYAGTTHRMSASTARATGQVTYAFEALTGTVDTVSAPSGSNVPSKRFRAWQRVGVPASGTGLSEATPATPSYADSARAVLSWARYTGYLPGMPQYEQDTAWFAMDRTGAPTKVARPLVGLVTIDRDSTGLPVHITTAGGAEVWQSWNASGSLLKSKMKVRAGWTTTAVRYDSTRYVYNTAWQELDSIIPPAGDTVTFKYDASGRRDSVIDALGNVTRFYYKNNGLVWKVAAPHPTVAGGEEPLPTVFLYDSTLTWNLLSASKGTDTTRYRYDSTRVIADTVLNALGDFTAYEYDKMGRVTKQTQVALSLTSGVNGYQRLQPPNQIVSYSFNDAARLVTQTDPLGWQSTWLHDPAGRLVRRCVRESWCDSTTYQDGMNPTKQLSRRGDWTDVAFDAGGRPIAKVLTEFSPTQRDDSVSYVYDTDGILTQVRNQYSRIFFRYDPYGRRRSEAQLIRNWADTTFASGLTFYHEYDPNGRRAKTYLNGNVQCSPCANPATDSVLVAYQQPLTFTYFGNGNLKEINNPFWPVSPQKWSYSYDRKSRARGLAYPTTTPNVYNDSLAYDDNDRVAWHSFGSSSAEGTETILPDQIGRTLTRQSGQTVSYAYDGRGELILNSSSGAIAA
ncbi:MAG: RHS repeat domain-containing protein, partial [Gemmatimonadaceae bacterium]